MCPQLRVHVSHWRNDLLMTRTSRIGRHHNHSRTHTHTNSQHTAVHAGVGGKMGHYSQPSKDETNTQKCNEQGGIHPLSTQTRKQSAGRAAVGTHAIVASEAGSGEENWGETTTREATSRAGKDTTTRRILFQTNGKLADERRHQQGTWGRSVLVRRGYCSRDDSAADPSGWNDESTEGGVDSRCKVNGREPRLRSRSSDS
jgi:hypothetical protein